MKWISALRAARLRRTSPWRAALADLPAGLEIYWRASAPREYEGILGGCQKAAPQAAFFFARAAEGLLRFFDAVRHSGRPCALPSEAADSVWHAWLRWSPTSLDRFCVRHFGAPVPHVERAALVGNALLNTFAACRERDDIRPGSMRLPALFALDAQLRMPRGHGYWSRGGEIVYAHLNERGRGMWRARAHPELALTVLYAAGLVDRSVLAAHMRRREATVDGSSCGGMAFADGGDACADGGGGDGGGDGGSCGSSCGSSCGGGCGGGD
ncbi:MAG: hypothetical protein JF619_04445 [Massilia sp.]|nr:hypothetical protein [Massilia sp.]